MMTRLKQSRSGPLRKTTHGESSGVSVPSFPVVGIGASAGGLAAFEAFFAGLPSDRNPDMAFVLVQHLAPDHKSILGDLIQRHTKMAVHQVSNRTLSLLAVEVNATATTEHWQKESA